MAFAGFSLVRALLLAGEPARALELLLESGGGEELPRMPGAWRAGGYELFTLLPARRSASTQDAARAAERCAQLAEQIGLRLRRGAGRARRGRGRAGDRRARPRRGARARGGRRRSTRSRRRCTPRTARVLAGRALAASGDRGGAIAQLERAAEIFERCGAPRRRDEAEHELRRLGRTIYRRSGASGLETLTARELEIARLVVDRQTNTQIAAALFLSKKTVETHLRNIFGKVGVSSRVELARAVERSDRAP